MKLSTLIKKIGDGNIEVQSIATSLVKVQQKKHDAEVTIATDKGKGDQLMQGIMSGKPDIVGILCWVSREDYLKATKESP